AWLRQGRAAEAAESLDEALGLWRGEALADVLSAPFAAAAAARFAELRLAAVEDCWQARLQAGVLGVDSVAELEELIAAHPFREGLRTLLVRVLAASGRNTEALTAFEQYRRMLSQQLGADPGQELLDAHVAVLRSGARVPGMHRPGTQRPGTQRPGRAPGSAGSGPGSAPPSTGRAPMAEASAAEASAAQPETADRSDRPRGNLVLPLSSLVGRADQIALIDDRLRGSRLVTLVGPGGVGKTRLAKAVLAERDERTAGGTWLVELASLTESGDLARVVADTVGLRELSPADRGPDRGPDGAPDGAAVLARLIEVLGRSRTLLLLDNCEHLLDAVARFVEQVLSHCRDLRILVTSREALGLPGEALCPVPPLAHPAVGVTVEQAAGYPAVQLLQQRAEAVRPDFRLAEDNIAAVVEICARLDGLPLAIELAAARFRSMPLPELLTRLDDRFRLLGGGSRTALPRHQTLRAVMAWSWGLLSPEERSLAELLAVFPGDITLAAAEGVCERAGVPAETVVDLLSALVDKSLLSLADQVRPRYRMLATIREYGRDRLIESGRIEQARRHHAAYFLDLAETAAPQLRGADQVGWIRRLDGERENLSAASSFAAASGDADTTVRLAAALGMLWTIGDDHAEAAARLHAALRVPGAAPELARAAAAGFHLINTLFGGGSARAGLPLAEYRALAASVAEVDDPVAVLLEPALAVVVDDEGWGLSAIDRRLPDRGRWTAAMLWMLRAFLLGNHGDMGGARDSLREATEAFRAAGERWGLAMALTALSEAEVLLGGLDGAVAGLQEAIGLLAEIDPGDAAVLQRSALAAARQRAGDIPRARAELQAIVGTRPEAASARHLVFARIALGNLARYEGDLVSAREFYDAAEADLEHAPTVGPLFRAALGVARGHLAVATGDAAAAEPELRAAVALAASVPDMPIVATVGVAVAELRAAAGRPGEAAALLGAAHALRGAADNENPDVARVASVLAAALGAPAYEQAYADGRGRGRRVALELIEQAVG
ncbi:ATP-binding protein, partial [Catenulispora rubra]|uniref:ATP-binding protein n=1 Tax=Catenulispora rubra TaxID=280293 RepID=UPI001892512E